MRRITLTDEQYRLLLEIIGHSDNNCLGNETLSKMYPDRADQYRSIKEVRDGLDRSIEAADITVQRRGESR